MNHAHTIDPDTYIIRIEETARRCGTTRKGLDNLRIKDPTFPRPVPLSDSKARGAPKGFVLGEVQRWIEQRKAKREQPA